jgi:hypothetical protein
MIKSIGLFKCYLYIYKPKVNQPLAKPTSLKSRA